MLMEDQSGSNSIKLTKLDSARLNNLEIGSDFVGELQNFKILRYKNDYVLILFNHHTKKDFQEFMTKEELIKFLNEN
jgi:hypothetical protein